MRTLHDLTCRGSYHASCTALPMPFTRSTSRNLTLAWCRYGELKTQWVSQDPAWSFSVTWEGSQHAAALSGSQQLALVLHGVDTLGDVLLNGRRVLQTDNAHR